MSLDEEGARRIRRINSRALSRVNSASLEPPELYCDECGHADDDCVCEISVEE